MAMTTKTVDTPSVAKQIVTNKLDIAEQFYSVQCEGSTTGVPAYFIRLKACNLMCGGTNGELVKSGDATWWCDSEAVWKQGMMKPFFRLPQDWEKLGIKDWVMNGRVHLIWTGGEPTIPRHQRSIVAFLDWLNEQETNVVYNEIETNGTIPLTDDLSERLQQINCSPKLSNSGMSSARRIVPAAIDSIMKHPNYWFKFVISNEEDIQEIENDFITPYNIPATRIILMPGLDKQEDYHERTRFCLETAKKHGYIGMTRLHISAWDQTTGV
jgi:7-carboxy-7-deazaguanine synthase